jgi:hypothetical protein
MKTRNVSILTLSVGVGAILVTSFFSGFGLGLNNNTHPKKSNKFKIEFAVDSEAEFLEITSALCTGSNPQAKGCFKVKQGKSGVVLYTFNAASPWKLKEFKICKGSSKDSLTCDLNDWERMEFAVANAVENADGEFEPGSTLTHTQMDGSIDLSGLVAGSDSTRFFLLDVNTIKQEYFYNIEACNGSNCISIDPPLDNRGRN